MMQFVGRTVPSGDSVHDVALIVIDDDGAWLVRRPHELERAEIPELIELAREGKENFARSRGGHLNDDLAAGRVGTVGMIENWLYEFVAVQQGAMLQNLGLMSQALGLGGFPHFAAHPYAWFEALGFDMRPIPFSRTIGGSPLMTAAR